MKINQRNIFLIDGLGACVSALFLGVLLVELEAHFGMPRMVLYYLAGLAGLFAIYSLTCHFRKPHNWQPFLMAIIIANLLYSCLTTGLVIYFIEPLTNLGLAYFVLEVIIIWIIVWLEWNTLKSVSK